MTFSPQFLDELRDRAGLASVIGRDLSTLRVLQRGLCAIADAGHECIGATQGPRNVDVQFVMDRDVLKPAIKALHGEFIGTGEALKAAA